MPWLGIMKMRRHVLTSRSALTAVDATATSQLLCAFPDIPASLMVITSHADRPELSESRVERAAPAGAGESVPESPLMLRRAQVIKWQRRDAFCNTIRRYLQPERELPDDQQEALFMAMNREWFQLESDGLLNAPRS